MADERNVLYNSEDPGVLRQQISELRHQLAASSVRQQVLWTLLITVGQRLQSSSTSIKAAVSSLLDYNIFWDGSTQHEFLETINSSVDQGASLTTLMTLAFRAEAGGLEMKPEPHILQEILSGVADMLYVKAPECPLQMDFPTEGQPVWIDYEYLAISLRLLFDVLLESKRTALPLRLLAVECQDGWRVTIDVSQESIATMIKHLRQNQFADVAVANGVSPENTLKLFTALEICHLQGIRLDVHTDEEGKAGLSLTIPVAAIS